MAKKNLQDSKTDKDDKERKLSTAKSKGPPPTPPTPGSTAASGSAATGPAAPFPEGLPPPAFPLLPPPGSPEAVAFKQFLEWMSHVGAGEAAGAKAPGIPLPAGAAYL